MGNEKEIQEYSEELIKIVEEFREKIVEGTKDSEKFLTITEIERMWTELKGNTNVIYTEMLSELLSQVDEKELIRKKKQNTRGKG